MAVNLSPIWGAGAQLLDNSGNVLSGGKIYTYAAGTTTPATTYTSSTGGTANSNPIILNSAGRVPYEIWMTDGQVYKFVLKDSNDTLIATYDNLVGINSNFVNFTNQQEIQTATAGQTVFTLTTVNYSPGTNSLSVFVDGVNQYGPGAQYAYVETSSTVVTFVTGLHVGASVKFTTSQLNSSSGVDAAQVSYVPPFTGSVATNVEDKLAQTVSVKDFGAAGDGITDDTAAIQAALDNAGIITFPGGTYVVDPLNVFSDTTLILDPSTVLQAKTGYGANDRLLNINNVSNVAIQGNFAKIEMLKSEYVTGEQRHGVFIVTGVNVTINDLIVTDTGGDGFYVGSYNNVDPSYNITLNNCISDNAKRNGLSIVSVKNCWVNGGEYKNTLGSSPQSGIDIEPNSSSDFLWNVNLNGVSTYNNYGDGISVVLGEYGATSDVETSINIVDCTSRDDAQAFGNFGLRFVNGPYSSYKIYGSINVTNFTSVDSGYSGIGFLRLTENYPNINITKSTIINPGNNVAAVNANETTGVFLSTAYNAAGGWPASTTQNISINGLLVEDARSVAKMNNGLYIQSAVNYPIKYVTIENVLVVNYTNVPFVIASAAINGITETIIVQPNPKTVTFGGTTPDVIRWAGNPMTTSAPGNFTLSAASASWYPGFVLSFVATASTMTLVPYAGDTILFQGLAASAGLILEPGDSISLKSVSTGWEVVNQNFPLKTGAGSPVGSVTTRFVGRQYFDTSGKNFWVSTGTTSADWKITT